MDGYKQIRLTIPNITISSMCMQKNTFLYNVNVCMLKIKDKHSTTFYTNVHPEYVNTFKADHNVLDVFSSPSTNSIHIYDIMFMTFCGFSSGTQWILGKQELAIFYKLPTTAISGQHSLSRHGH